MSAFRRLCALSALLLVAALPTVGPSRAEGGGDSTVLSFGSAAFAGSTGGALVGTAAAPGGGYWLVARDGGVFSYGGAPFHGSPGGTPLNQPVVGMAAHPAGGGYWLVARDGGVFSYGAARFFGSTGGMPLNQPIVGMAPTPDGNGYWLVARDGGVFAFGSARFLGSMGGTPLNQPVTGMAATRTGNGYWLVAADGGLFAFGDAGFFGSASPYRPKRVTSMAASATGNGYWLASSDGALFAFGDAGFAGSGAGRVPPGKAVVSMAAAPDGRGYWLLSADDILPPGTLAGASVDTLQRRMLDLGYFVQLGGSGEVMRQAVYAVQKAAGLPRTGVVGGAERAALERAARPPTRSRSGYVVEIDKTRQLIVAVRDGQPIWTFNTSTGNGRPYLSGGRRAVAVTPEGQFRIYNQINGLRRSELGVLWRPKYFTGGYAMHGSPSIPPYPASHGCARLSNAAIDFIWSANVMPMGTPVWVYS